MDQAQSLDALANVLNELAESPYDITLHAKHIRLAQSIEGMEAEVQSAIEMLPQFLAAGEGVWLALIHAKTGSLDLESAEGVEELLALYNTAEADYLSIPILQKHLQFLLDRNAHYLESGTRPTDLGDLFSIPWTRKAITEVVNKGIGHLTQSHLLWDLQRDWELQILEATPPSERASLVDSIQLFLLDRLRQPHADSDETSQVYSTFTTNYKPPAEYEALLITASKIKSQGTKAFERRESFETALVQTGFSLDAFAHYLASERRAKNTDTLVMSTIYERAIAEAAKRCFNGELGADAALRAFWVGYSDSLRISDAGEDVEFAVLKRAVRSVPGSGEVWARYIRFLERHEDLTDIPVSDVFNQAFSMKMLQTDVEQIVPAVLARASYERRRESEDDEIIATLIAVLENGIEMVHQASKTGDARFRLEKYLTEIYDNVNLPDGAIAVWQSAANFNKSSYLAWTSYTDTLIKHGRLDEARKIFTDINTKNLDWPEAVWEAWTAFEHLHGSVEELETCLIKIEKAHYQVAMRRAKQAQKASLEAMQVGVETQATNVLAAEVPVPNVDLAMDVDVPQERGTKRGAEDEFAETNKKAKIDKKTVPLKRDRENATVFVAGLPSGATEEDLAELFKDCGEVREVKVTQLSNLVVATVEFFDRDSIPAALTKDKKRLHGQEVAVHLAWKSTLYVTNFPESADDTMIRDVFGNYGTLFDVRWPSKKYKNTRRFCYVQFTSLTSAEKALELHGRELEPGLPLNVFTSNPERRKERTDYDANERELYVAGLSKFTSKADLEKLFKTYGTIKEVRMAEDEKGHSKGFAFVEFEQEKDALAALDANNYELKKRRIAVTLADSRVRAKARNTPTSSGLGQGADARSRSIRIRNLPIGTQEGLLQQALEKIAAVKRVEVLMDLQEAIVELESAAEAGKMLLRAEPVIFNGNALQLFEEGQKGAPKRRTAPPPKTGGMFVPRAAASRPRAGLGHARKHVPDSSDGAESVGSKGQQDFRKMLEGNR